MATPTASGLSSGEFDAFIDAIGAHSKARIQAVTAGHDAPPAYPLPGYLAQSQLDQIPGPVQQALDAYCRQPTDSQLESNVPNVAPAAVRCAGGEMSQDDFNNLLEQQIVQNNSQFAQMMDDAMPKLQDLGNQHPDWMNVILQTYSKFLNFAAGMWAQVADYLHKLGQDPRNLLLGIESAFKSFQQQVDSFFFTGLMG
ncbi:hypothetical protein OG563_30440 [Nocardia vinacea]|uniref:ESX-1 secretion-associated protein EspA/EspE-like domain-containing protein n=1 Tax=Nocardia vinacea TaxID=96468 RepID=A0ABZ1YJW3_9NOCA|nr:hypothetical protein [Nocardia vinacea]